MGSLKPRRANSAWLRPKLAPVTAGIDLAPREAREHPVRGRTSLADGLHTPAPPLPRYRAGVGFEWAYRNGVPPWDIGWAQPAIVRLAEEGLIAGDVIDVGCGTGENVLYLASRGLAVIGVDAAPTAIAQAQEKARLRGSSATFLVADALALEGLGRTFDMAIDCGLFHTFSDADRVRFERSPHRTLRAGSRYVLLCFNEHQPGELGPRRVTQAEIRATFATGWAVDSIVADRFDAKLPGNGAHAWLVVLTRT